jgi:predicted AAA+ superfamily ATPase
MGGYPVIVTTENPSLREKLLGELVGAYLYWDILELEGVRCSEKIVDLLRLLAFQIGQEVSIAKLTANLALNRQTVERYLDLLEKVFVIFRIGGFSRNLRKEITKNARYYFFDNGVRNSLIQNFNSLTLRDDVGKLWENYLQLNGEKQIKLLVDQLIPSFSVLMTGKKSTVLKSVEEDLLDTSSNGAKAIFDG